MILDGCGAVDRASEGGTNCREEMSNVLNDNAYLRIGVNSVQSLNMREVDDLFRKVEGVERRLEARRKRNRKGMTT